MNFEVYNYFFYFYFYYYLFIIIIIIINFFFSPTFAEAPSPLLSYPQPRPLIQTPASRAWLQGTGPSPTPALGFQPVPIRSSVSSPQPPPVPSLQSPIPTQQGLGLWAYDPIEDFDSTVIERRAIQQKRINSMLNIRSTYVLDRARRTQHSNTHIEYKQTNTTI